MVCSCGVGERSGSAVVVVWLRERKICPSEGVACAVWRCRGVVQRLGLIASVDQNWIEA